MGSPGQLGKQPRLGELVKAKTLIYLNDSLGLHRFDAALRLAR
jgi:hypothetical protein